MSSKITELPEANNLTSDDLLLIVNDPGGSPETQKITVSNVFANVSVSTAINANLSSNGIMSISGNSNFTNLHISFDSTPVSSSDTVTKGKIWFDSTYLYVAVTNDQIKRITLESF